ncbi:hypothetical protein X801_07558 [Opisthorchis viverrini]|uniref:Uncharacterized protein n=1 Tax=Opisthorchis viverrini TaxID=6198 RepID=A0A1S8WQ66_OPIVI|nr:hypothetical protein X801_07558 [Opisthorchis viverrini]
MDYSSDLNSQHMIQTIVRRLPSRLRFKWAKAVANIRREDREPEVTDLTACIEARVDSLCSDYAELPLSLPSANGFKPFQLIVLAADLYLEICRMAVTPQLLLALDLSFTVPMTCLRRPQTQISILISLIPQSLTVDWSKRHIRKVWLLLPDT